MKNISNIFLWANGGSNDLPALRRAIQIANVCDANITVIGVVKDSPNPILAFIKGAGDIDLQSMVIAEMSTYLEKLLKKVKQDSIELKSKVLIGSPFFSIIQEVLKEKCDLVISSAKDETGINEMIFGSNTMHLLRKCPCPVLVLKPTTKRKIKKILVAVNVESKTSEKVAFNRLLVENAIQLSTIDMSEVHVVYTWSIYGEYHLWHKANLEREEVKNIISEAESLHRKELTTFLDKYTSQLPKKQIHLIKGEAKDLIPELAKKLKADLVVMGTVGRVGVQGFIMGNTAEKILQHIDCSIMAIKPDGFVSPIIGG